MRALGIAAGLQARGVVVELSAPASSTNAVGIVMSSLDKLDTAVRSAAVVVVPAALVNQFPEVRAAHRLCVDFAGPYPLEARASGLSARDIAAADQSAADAIACADLIICSQPRQIDYALDLVQRVRPDTFVPRDAFILLPFGVVDGSSMYKPVTRTHQGLRLVWPGGLWDWLDPFIVIDAMRALPSDITVEFWGSQNSDRRAPRMGTAARLTEHADAAGLADRVAFVEWVPRDEFDKRLMQFDAAITFDDGGDEARHAFRTRLLHALACGVPTIATRGEFVADLAAARGAGWTIAPRSIDDLCTTLMRLYDDPNLLSPASSAACTLAAEFSYPRLVEPLIDWIGDSNPRHVHRSTSISFRQRLRRMVRKHLD